MKKIRVPIDGSPNSFRGLSKAVEIAKHENVSLFLFHVVTASPSIVIGASKKVVNEKIMKGIKKNIIDPAVEKCKKKDIPLEYKLVYGSDPGYDIVKFANSYSFYMLVIGARGTSKLKKIFVGSASDYVLNKAKMPVLLVK
ncbi:universal stress protein [Nitrosopumilus sp.]|uniref:universal stress protein n=1 Tax=Nitrosopumilus sp. TaxID=2024843 RepID=UPI0026258A94|nr:universal stress protein [Nitrosopumilus sp.]